MSEPTSDSVDCCIFCDNPRQLKRGCEKQRWMVCEDHMVVKCPECGGSAHWLEGMKKGNYYLCFESLECWWRGTDPPNPKSTTTRWPSLRELPPHQQEPFEQWLVGQTRPWIEGLPGSEQDGYYA